MALLIDIRQPSWMADEDLRDRLAPALPGVAVHCGDQAAGLEDVVMVATSALRPGLAARLPKLRLVQKLGAGVETMLRAPDLPPSVRVARLKTDEAAAEIAEYCVAYVLRDQRNIEAHARDAAEGIWRPIAPRAAPATTIAVLGLGHIGGRVATTFAQLGFRVTGWSRTPKSLPGVACVSGMAALDDAIADADYVASILPATPATDGLFNAARLARMKPSAVLINAGRGGLIVDADLLSALDAGRLGGAVLDVFQEEPLPRDHPYWRHPKVTVTPHVSGWRVDSGLDDVAENYRRLVDGRPLLHEVDRMTGY